MSMPMAVGTMPGLPLHRLLIGAAAATLARIALRALSFHRVIVIVRWLAARTRYPATIEDVLGVLRAIDAAAAWLPFRVACLERSLAAVCLLAARRRGVVWQVGVRTPPFAMHAWLTASTGESIGEPQSTVAYQPLIQVTPSTENEWSTT